MLGWVVGWQTGMDGSTDRWIAKLTWTCIIAVPASRPPGCGFLFDLALASYTNVGSLHWFFIIGMIGFWVGFKGRCQDYC
jgi:hypothetical protein